MTEYIVAFALAAAAGIVTGVSSSVFMHWFERHKMKRNLMRALDVETNRNCQIAQLNARFENDYTKTKPANVKIFFTPFHCDVWHSIINHGLLNSFDNDIVVDLVKIYNLIYEVNSWISVQNYQDDCYSPISSSRSSDSLQKTHVSELIFEGSKLLIAKIIDLRREMSFK